MKHTNTTPAKKKKEKNPALHRSYPGHK